jgi:hypothetical protein
MKDVNMKKHILSVTVLLVVFLLNLNAMQDNKITLAVLNFEAKSGVSNTEASTLSDRLRSMLVNSNVLMVIERGQMTTILEEQGFQQTGCTSTECIVEAGKLLNVQKMVSGAIGKLGQTYTIDLALINVETAQIEESYYRNYKGEIDGLLEVMESITNQIVQTARGEKRKTALGLNQVLLTVTSSPSNAIITINDQQIARTPYTIPVKRDEEFNISVDKENYKKWQRKLTITEDREINAVLETKSVAKQVDSGTFAQGKIDGENSAKGNIMWVPGGAVFSWLAIGYAYLNKPTPPTYALVGKSSEYIMGFTEGYQNKSRTLNTRYACLGCAATYGCLYIIISQNNSN